MRANIAVEIAADNIQAAILQKPALFLQALKRGLRKRHLVRHADQCRFAAMHDLHRAGVTIGPVTLLNALEKRGEASTCGGYAALFDLEKNLPRYYGEFDAWVDIVIQDAMAREIAALSERLTAELQKAEADPLTILLEHEERVLELRRSHSPASTAPMFVGALKFASEATATTDWLVEELIPAAGNGIIGGDPKATKSFAALDLGIALSCGVPWMSRRVGRRIKVALVSREDEPGLTRRRLKRLIAGRKEYSGFSDEWMQVNTRQQQADFQVTSSGHMDKLINELGRFGAELVILDVFRTLHQAEENDNTEVAKVLAKITRIQTELKCATLLVHHIAKTEHPNPFKGLRGASCIHGWMEFGMAINVMNPEEADRANYVRRIQFESKECAVSDVYYKIVGSPDHATVCLQQQNQWERPRATRGKVESILPAPRDGKNMAAGG